MTKISHDSETPADGQQIISASAFIYHNFDGAIKVFMPKRADTKKFLPGVYEMCGGHIDFGEDIVEGLKREIKEEINMEVKVGDPFFVFTYVNEIKGSHTIEVAYFAEFVGDINNIQLNPEDHSDYKWFGQEDIDEIIKHNRRGNDPEMQAIRKGFLILGMK